MKNGSLFNLFLAIVKENNVENELSGELPFSRLKMGDRKGLERNGNLREFHFIHLFHLTWLDKR